MGLWKGRFTLLPIEVVLLWKGHFAVLLPLLLLLFLVLGLLDGEQSHIIWDLVGQMIVYGWEDWISISLSED